MLSRQTQGPQLFRDHRGLHIAGSDRSVTVSSVRETINVLDCLSSSKFKDGLRLLCCYRWNRKLDYVQQEERPTRHPLCVVSSLHIRSALHATDMLSDCQRMVVTAWSIRSEKSAPTRRGLVEPRNAPSVPIQLAACAAFDDMWSPS